MKTLHTHPTLVATQKLLGQLLLSQSGNDKTHFSLHFFFNFSMIFCENFLKMETTILEINAL
jgi:hypothetical protein